MLDDVFPLPGGGGEGPSLLLKGNTMMTQRIMGIFPPQSHQRSGLMHESQVSTEWQFVEGIQSDEKWILTRFTLLLRSKAASVVHV